MERTCVGAPLLLLACLVTGVFSNAIGYGIDQYVLREVSVRRFSVLLAMLPVTAVIVGWVALSQQPSALDLVGIIAVLIGVSVQERYRPACRPGGSGCVRPLSDLRAKERKDRRDRERQCGHGSPM